MGDGDVDDKSRPRREQTDESLRFERIRADAAATDKRDAVEEKADEVVRLARELADQVVDTARNAADLGRTTQPASGESSAIRARERDRADSVVEDERSRADALLKWERSERRRYLNDFLAVERETTDRDLVRERDHADRVVATRDEFLATVSHDLRSLLGGLSLAAGLLVKHAPEGEGGDKIRRHAATSQRLVARMNRMVNDLLDLSSIEAGRLALLPEEVEVGEILRDTLDAFGSIAASKQITLDAGSAGPPIRALLDGGRIEQVLANLVSNAIKFTPENGRVSIRIRADDKEIQFAVNDTGIGIPAEDLPGVFERFRQVSKADRRGLGLGLHISMCIVEAHGGRMWAESQVGEGSTFHFALPAAVLLPAEPALA